MEAHKLALYTINSSTLYRRQAQPIIANLRKKMAKGVYDADKALKMWKYLADSGAQEYTKEFGGVGNGSYGCFTVVMRRAAAVEIAAHYASELTA